MKQEEKSRASYKKILDAAIAEFGTKSYENASLNNICSSYKISKGLIYHNFKNKDELYLRCVEVCFDEMTAYLRDSEYNSNYESIKKLLDLRYEFFRKNPYYSNIFFHVIIDPPRHLSADIKKIRAEFDEFHFRHYRKVISHLTLREGITSDMAIEYFIIFQESFNGYFQSRFSENIDFNSLIQDHEMKLSEILNIMLYGIAKEV